MEPGEQRRKKKNHCAGRRVDAKGTQGVHKEQSEGQRGGRAAWGTAVGRACRFWAARKRLADGSLMEELRERHQGGRHA